MQITLPPTAYDVIPTSFGLFPVGSGLSKRILLGGTSTLNAHHFYGTFKWMAGAVKDVVDGNQVSNPYIYGELTDSTGITNLKHIITISWK